VESVRKTSDDQEEKKLHPRDARLIQVAGRGLVMRNACDARKHEMALGEAGAEDYERGISKTGWTLIHEYFVSGRWGRKFNGLFLDYGCGTGLVARNLVRARRNVVAMDISKSMCKIAKDICGVEAVVADCLHLPFTNRAFSIICVSGALHHLRQHLESAFLEIGRCARRGICIIEPSTTPPGPVLRLLLLLHRVYEGFLHRTAYRGMRRKYTHSVFEGPLDPHKLQALCEKQGFKVSELKFFNHFPYFPPFSVSFVPERLRRHLVKGMISREHGTDVEIIAERC